MSDEQEMTAAIDLAVEIGNLRGQLAERERSRDELKALLDAMQDEVDLMRERAVRAETQLMEANKTVAVLEKL